jgi:hypothetical protein
MAEKARAFLASPEAKSLTDMVAGNKLGAAPERLAEMAGLKERLAQLVASKGDDVSRETADVLANPVKRAVLPRVKTLIHRAAPAWMGAAGGMMGGTTGGVIGGALGTATAMLQGRPGVVVANMLKDPGVRRAAWNTVQAVIPSHPEVLGPLGVVIAREIQSGGLDAGLAMHHALMQENPEYATKVLEQTTGQSLNRE